MHRFQCVLVLLLSLRGRISASPPEPMLEYIAEATTHSTILAPNNNIQPLTDLMRSIEDQLKQFHALYLGRLDQKLTSLATEVAALSSNVRNIQERAHVWDTFQLHVSAWNEQIKSVDRKVDIINSGQEKLALLETKLNILTTIEYNQHRTLLQLSSLEDRISSWQRTKQQDAPLYGGLACRGLGQALQDMEGKLDQLVGRRTFTERRPHGVNSTVTTAGKKLFIRCFTPPVVEELVKDMSSKVDLIYDRLNSERNPEDDEEAKEDEAEETMDHDYSVEMYQSDEDVESKGEKGFKLNQSEARAVRKLFRHLTASPNKKIEELRHICERDNNKLQHFEHLLKQNKINWDESRTNSDFLKKSLETISGVLENSTEALKRLENNAASFESVDDKLKNLRNDFRDIFSNQFIGSSNATVSKEIVQPGDNLGVDSGDKHLSVLPIDSVYPENNATVEISTSAPNVGDELLETSNRSSSAVEVLKGDMDFMTFCGEYLEDSDAGGAVVSVRQLACDIVRRRKLGEDDLQLCKRPGSMRYCDGNDVIFQARNGAGVNFSRTWDYYKWGFGSLDFGEYWLGLEPLHQLTGSGAGLKVHLKDFSGLTSWANYDKFEVGDEGGNYTLRLVGYSGNATDSLAYHSGSRFSTRDRNNDESPSCCPCSESFGGAGWWFKNCIESNLNGLYFAESTNNSRGIIWEHWTQEFSLAESKMAAVPAPKMAAKPGATTPEDP